MNLINKIVSVISGFPKTIVFVLIGISLSALVIVPNLKNDPNPYLLAKTHPARVNLDSLRENYTGSKDSIIVLLESSKSIFNHETLNRIKNLTNEFEKINLFSDADVAFLQKIKEKTSNETKPLLNVFCNSTIGINSWDQFNEICDLIYEQNTLNNKELNHLEAIKTRLMPVVEVTSLSNTDNITGVNDSIHINPLYNKTPDSQELLDLIKKHALDNDLFDNFLITKNSKYSCIIIELAIKESETNNQYMMLGKVKEILEKNPGKEKHYIAGFPVVTAVVGHTMEVDSGRLLPIVLLLVISCLWISFRTMIGVLIPLVVVICSLIITLALKVLFNIPMNIVTSTLPVFILSIGVADGIHIFTVYRNHVQTGDKRPTAVQKTVRELSRPVMMTSVTTSAAFLTLSVTEIIQIKYFGLFVSAGVIIAMIYSIFFIPALLLILPKFTAKSTRKISKIDIITTKFLNTLTKIAITKPVMVIALFLITIIISIYGTYQVRVENNPIAFHKPDTDLVVSTNKINSSTAGTLNLNLLINSNSEESDPFTDAKNLKPVAGLIEHIEQNEIVGKVFSLTKLIERINLVMHNNDPNYNKLPGLNKLQENTHNSSTVETSKQIQNSKKNLISQYLLLYENGGGDILGDVVNSTYTQLNIPIVLKSNSSIRVERIIGDIERYVDEYFPKDLEVQFSGSANEMVAATNEIVSSQVTSLLMSFVIIFLFLILTFRSFITGLLAMIPLSVTVLFNFGIMGFFGISLDIGTTVIGSIAIGIGIDYSIHYLSRLKEYLGEGLTFQDSIQKTVQHSGKAILLNAFTVGTGFIAMLFSIFTPLITMGWMITSTMIVSSLCTIILLPAVLGIIPVDFLRSALTNYAPRENEQSLGDEKLAA